MPCQYDDMASWSARWEPAPVLLQCNKIFPLLSKTLHISELFPPSSKSSQYLRILYFVNGNHIICTMTINRFKAAFSKKRELFSIRSVYIRFYWLLITWSCRELILATRIVCESRDVKKAMNETLEGSRGQCYPKLSSIMAKESKAKLVTGMRVLIQALCLFSVFLISACWKYFTMVQEVPKPWIAGGWEKTQGKYHHGLDINAMT